MRADIVVVNIRCVSSRFVAATRPQSLFTSTADLQRQELVAGRGESSYQSLDGVVEQLRYMYM